MRGRIWDKLGLGTAAAILAIAVVHSGHAEQNPPAAATPAQAAAPSAEDADAAILDRQLIMQAIDEDLDKLGDMLTRLFDPKRPLTGTEMVPLARKIATDAKESRESFKINAPGGGSKPEVWTNSADFTKRMDAFVATAEAMAVAAEANDANAAAERAADFDCKGCHQAYRVQKAK